MASDGNQRLNEGELLRSMYHYLPGKGDLYCASLERGVRTRANVPGGLAARPAQPARAPCPCRATLWRSGRPERPLRALRRHCGELRPRERCGRPRGPIWEDFSFLARRVAPLTRHASASSPLPPRAQVPPEGATAARSAQQNRSSSATGAAAAGQQKHADQFCRYDHTPRWQVFELRQKWKEKQAPAGTAGRKREAREEREREENEGRRKAGQLES